MARSRIDTSIERVVKGEFSFPLGVYPVEEFAAAGCSVQFEAADGQDDEGDWEEWPDRYVFDIVVPAQRLEPLCRTLFSLLPGRVYPILDILGNDAYREVDPHIAYDLVGVDRFLDAIRRHRGWFYEDGLVGFGAMSLEPFVYIFVDEHKIVTVRVQTDLRERVEAILSAFDIAVVDEPQGVDAAVHEHRTVLDAPADRPDLLTSDEIVEELVEDWRLRLNVDREGNRDENDADLGVTGWRCLVRHADLAQGELRYAEMLLRADSLEVAERLAFTAVLAPPGGGNGQVSTPPTPDVFANPESGDPTDDDDENEIHSAVALVAADRLTPEEYAMLLAGRAPEDPAPAPPAVQMDEITVDSIRWLDG